MTFDFLDVGMGDSTLVRIRHGKNNHDTLMLVDFGEKRTPFKVPYRDAMKYLVDVINKNSLDRKLKHPFIDYLVITHPDADHYNKIEELVNQTYPNFKNPVDSKDKKLHFKKVYFSGHAKEYGGALLTNVLKELTEQPVMPLADRYRAAISKGVPQADLTFNNVYVYILSSNWPSRNGSPNPKSIVLAFELNGRKVILPGDAGRRTEEQILNTFPDGFLQCTALKMGHHGSNSSSSPEWVQATSPSAIFASGDMVWSHPYADAICRFVENKSLSKSGIDDVYYVSGKRRVYYNNPTELAIGMSLNYFVEEQTVKLVSSDGKKFRAKAQETFGVQWQLIIVASKRKAMEVRATTLVSPAPGQKLPGPFKCGGAAETAPVPLGTPRAIDTQFTF